MGSERQSNPGDRYRCFAALAAAETAGKDYRIEVRERPASTVAVVAPHGGSIEHTTSALARSIAGDDFSLYLFEGLDPKGSFETLHITSHRFDEPRCLRLVAAHDIVVTVHGSSEATAALYLGGLDDELVDAIMDRLDAPEIDIRADDHPYPGRRRDNICNRGRHGRGVQLEFSDGLRSSDTRLAIAAQVRSALVAVAAGTR